MSTTLVPPSYYVVAAPGIRARAFETVAEAAAAIFDLAPMPTMVTAVTGSRRRNLTEPELRELGRSVRARRLLAHHDVKNVLVAYASKRGSTAEIARAIADKLRECGLSVECLSARDVHTIEPYDAVVLGSAVYVGRWPGDARHFLRRYADDLSVRPFWAFSSGPVGEVGAAQDPASIEPASIVERLEHLGVREHMVFGGRVLTDPKNRLERLLVERTAPGYRDRRDWREIHAWASSIAAELGAERPVSLAP